MSHLHLLRLFLMLLLLRIRSRLVFFCLFLFRGSMHSLATDQLMFVVDT
jgi:hypothetical protein